MTDKAPMPPLTDEDMRALETLADATVPNWTEWYADDHKDWASPQTYVEAKDRWGDSVRIVRFVDGEPHFCCTVGKAEYEWANAKFVAAANPLTIKRALTTIQSLQRQLGEAKAAARTPGTVEVCGNCGDTMPRVECDYPRDFTGEPWVMPCPIRRSDATAPLPPQTSDTPR